MALPPLGKTHESASKYLQHRIMTKELQEKLIAKYPVLFQDTGKSMRESCMYWGIAFGDGWYNIFDQLCEYLSKIAKRSIHLRLKQPDAEGEKYLKVNYPGIKFDQVKEKFGTMCVYWSQLPMNDYDSVASQLEEPHELDEALRRHGERIADAVDYAEFLSSKTCELTGQPGRLVTDGWWKVRCEECLAKENAAT
jgi:hypothetical protein